MRKYSGKNGFKKFGASRSEHVNGLLAITARAAEATLNERSYSNPAYSLEIIASALSMMNAQRLHMPDHREALRSAGQYAIDQLCDSRRGCE